MRILRICGSARPDSSNRALLNYLEKRYSNIHEFKAFAPIHDLPLFADIPEAGKENDNLESFYRVMESCDAVLIATPEYLKNIPAALKNALEWCNSKNSLADKSVGIIVYTPHRPRGEKSLEILVQSLLALNASVKAKMLIHQTEIRFDQEARLISSEVDDLLDAFIELLSS